MYRTRPLHATFLLIFLAIAVAFPCAAPGPCHSKAPAERPAHWAAPIEKKGLQNLFKVSDTLYRGAQPTRDGFLELKKMGIKTVINLREFHTDEKLINGLGFVYFQFPSATSKPRKEDYQQILDILQNPESQPVFVHCRRGADRTGTAVALYRIVVQGWSTEEAIKELQDGGYGYHAVFQEMIRFVRSFNNTP